MSIIESIAAARGSVLKVEASAGLGSGFAIDRRIALTNAHVVDGAVGVIVVDDNGLRTQGAVVWRHRDLDLAVVSAPHADWTALTPGDSTRLSEGTEVVTLGYPLGLGFTATRGIVSARRREYKNHIFIQIDASISPGSSGGPLLDEAGRVVGINTFLLRGGQALNFAIPIEIAMEATRPVLINCMTEGALWCAACGAPMSMAERFCLLCGARLSRDLGQRWSAEAALLASLAITREHSRLSAPAVTSLPEGPVRVRQMISELLDGLGLDSYEARTDRDHWTFDHGTARGDIGLRCEGTEPLSTMVYVRIAVGPVQTKVALAFYRRLLELNDSWLGMPSFAVDASNMVWLYAGRPIDGLDMGELNELLSRTRAAAESCQGLIGDLVESDDAL